MFRYSKSQSAAIALILDEDEEIHVRRRQWVHKAWRKRGEGEFATLYKHLIDDEIKFFEYFRMSKHCFELLSKLTEKLRKQDIHWRKAIPPRERLAVCLSLFLSRTAHEYVRFAFCLVLKFFEVPTHYKMGREDKATWKTNYFTKIITLLDDYPKCFIVGADNVGSQQMQQIRIALRGSSIILMGKNTMMRKAIKDHLETNPALEKLLPHIKGNVGFVFTRGDLVEVRDKLLENKVRAPARPGAIAPLAVVIPAHNTGLGPEKTAFFQALSIPTKISKGTIEIINDVHILKPGDKVGASEATLLNMLNISPFSYGLVVKQVYDSGTIFAPAILDIKPEDLRAKFQEGVANVAALSLAIGYPTVASAPHSIANGFKNLLAIAAATDIEFKEATTIKEFIKDPSKFAAATAAPAAAAAAPAAEKKEEEKAEKEDSESDDDMGFGLFD
ncbi:jg5742 [Pararge aegeria aegeria]|uniref:Large ribosomal subunit protein uL10 n=3 Tax=Pararge aegeria TaxID=116150 RepID=A0A8S4SMS0_9NEOP|nr:jg5742 [Pararge aegeria aegeria]